MKHFIVKRKLLRAFFWFLLTYTAVSSTIIWALQFGLISQSPRKSFATADLKEKNPLKEHSYAEQFAREYLFWTKGKEEQRYKRLKPFMATNLDVQAGLHLEHAGWNSYVANCNVWATENHPGNSSIQNVTVYAETVMTQVDKPSEQKRVNRYLVVSIQKAGSSYRVVDIPYFIQPPIPSNISSSIGVIKKGEPLKDQEYVEVTNFSKSFFKVYTTGEAQEIGYFIKNKRSNLGLTGVLKFVELKKLAAYREKENVVRTECEVEFEDLHSNAHLVYHMKLFLQKEGSQWYVLRVVQGGV